MSNCRFPTFQPVVDAFFETFDSLIEGNTNSAVGGEVALVYISEILFEGSERFAKACSRYVSKAAWTILLAR